MQNYTPIYHCMLVRQGTVKTEKSTSSTERAKRVCSELLKDSPQEKFCVVLLDTKKKVIGVSVITQGTLDASLVHPREVFRPAILANASSVIIAHNHPSGDLTPSAEDREVYSRLEKAGTLIGIAVLDHIIVGFDDEALSMREKPW